jgi:hypothetical protein
MSAGDKNAYHCETCHGYIVTVDLDDGVTPFMLACRVLGEPKDRANTCKGMMQSMFYPEEPWPTEDGYGVAIPTVPTWEWYKPIGRELAGLDSDSFEHVRKGGLLLRKRA